MLKKILVFGLPRTGTTVAQAELANAYKLVNLVEAYSGPIKTDVYQWTAAWDQGATKLLTTHITAYQGQLDIVELLKQGFDGLVVTQRSNLTDCVVSLYYAQNIAKQYHYTSQDQVPLKTFEFDLSRQEFFNEIPVYFETMNKLKTANIGYDVFDYDLWCQGHTQTILNQSIKQSSTISGGFVDAKLNYSTLCKNYQDVEKIIKTLIDKTQLC